MISRSPAALLALAFPLAALAATQPKKQEIPINYDEAKVGALPLPDPLVRTGGGRIADAAAWQRERAALRETFAREVYGRTPGGRPAGMRWKVTSVDRAALGGKAVRKQVTIWFTTRDDGPKMHLLVYQPVSPAGGSAAKWPAFLGLNYYGNNCVNADPGIALSTAWMRPTADVKIVNNRATEGTRGAHADRWDVENVVARGYATATVYYGDICEDRAEGLTAGVGALFGTRSVEARAGDEWGAIGQWAWGLSRALDYLENDPEIDATRVAVHGHSRLGKAALWAGAQDERFALVISNNSGEGGAALSKRDYGETVLRINTSFPFWFAKNFRAYNSRPAALPVDQHQLIALIAPRPVHVASALEDRWADPRGEFLAAKNAEPVYALFGRKGLGVADMPAVNRPVLGDGLAYHLRTGKHDITPYDWAQYLDHADRLWKKQ